MADINLGDAIVQALTFYTDDICAETKKAVDKVAKEVAKEIRTHITFRNRTGDYIRSFAMKTSYEDKRNKRRTWYVKAPHYRLTHLPGIMTWNGKTLKKLCSTARVTEDAAKRTVKIGGVGNEDGKKYVLRFLHEDAIDGDCRITIVGTNSGGLTLAFTKDKETVIDATFEAMPHDSDGTLIIYEEELIAEE